METNELSGGKTNTTSRRFASHRPVFYYFPITACSQVFYSLHMSVTAWCYFVNSTVYVFGDSRHNIGV